MRAGASKIHDDTEHSRSVIRHNQPVAILIHAYLACCSSLTGLAIIHRRQAGQIEGRSTVKYA